MGDAGHQPPMGGGSWIEEDRDPFPNGLATDIVVLLAVCLPVVLAALVLTVTRRTFRLSQVLSLVMAAALVAVGAASWATTYIETRAVLQARVETLMLRAADLASTRIKHELGSGAAMLELLVAHAAMGQLIPAGGFPAAQLGLSVMFVSLDIPPSVEAVFYGSLSTGGAADAAAPGFAAVLAVPNATRVTGDVVVAAHFPYSAPALVPTYLECPAVDRGPNATAVCAAYTCGTSEAADFACQETCAARAPPGRGRAYPDAAAVYCTTGEGEAPPMVQFFDARFSVGGGGQLAAASAARYRPQMGLPLNASARPWWTAARRAVVSRPYIYINDGTSVGVTMSVGLYDITDQFVGSAGVDFSLTSMQASLRALTPTARAAIHLADVNGGLVGTTFTWAELHADVGDGDGDQADASPDTSMIQDVTAIANPRSHIGFAFRTVAGRYNGSLEAAWSHRATLHAGGRILTSTPLGVASARYILVVDAPYADVMGAADAGSFRSLLITSLTSLAASVFVFVAVHQLLAPLRRLGGEMADVACMRLDAPAVVMSRVAEVRGMEESFRVLVLKLIEYREYLPQSVLLEDEVGDDYDDDEEEDDELADEKTMTSSSSRSSLAKSRGGSSVSTMRSVDNGQIAVSITSGEAKGSLPSDLGSSGSSLPAAPSRGASHKSITATTAVAAVKFALQLRSKQVSLLVVNAADFHAFALAVPPDAVVAAHAAYLHVVADSAKSRGGVVEGFTGDRVSVGFNSVGALSGHKTACVAAALEIVRRVRAQRTGAIPFAVNAACAGGRAQAGNMGAVGLKKHTVVGTVSTAVRMFERLGRQWGLDVVAGWPLLQGTAEAFETRYLHPVDVGGGAAQVLREVLNERTLADEEWMYAIQAAAAGSRVTASNNACELYFGGDTARALDVLYADADAGSMYAKALQAWFTAMPCPPAPLRAGREELPVEAAAYVTWGGATAAVRDAYPLKNPASERVPR